MPVSYTHLMGKTICEYYSNVTAKPVDWLWYPYIPYGKLTVIQGDPGEGKSCLLYTSRGSPDTFFFRHLLAPPRLVRKKPS